MRHLFKNRGVSLIELVVAMSLGGTLLYGVFMTVQQFKKLGQTSSALGDRADSVQEAYNTILKIGRAANSCLRVSATLLRCQVDFTVPPTGVLTTAEFELMGAGDEKNLVYRIIEAGVPKVRATYDKITAFSICNDALMTGGTCTIPTTGMSTQHGINLAATYPTKADHFFRFQITWSLPNNANAQNLANVSLSGAFYARNPTPVNGLVYQPFQKGS